MNDSRSFLLPSPSLSNLPPELLDEILTQKSLTKSDLAQCCLVSQRLLNSARRSLYSSINYPFFTLKQPTLGTKSYTIASPTRKLLETLKSSSILKAMVTTLRIYTFSPAIDGPEHPSIDEAVIELLQLLKNVTRLRLGGRKFGEVLDHVCANDARWKELDIRELDPGLDLASNDIFPNLRKLGCFKLSSSGTARSIYLPPYLSILRVQALGFGRIAIANVLESRLQCLRLDNNELLNLPDVSKLPKLQHLHLVYNDYSVSPIQTANTVNSCRSLTSLSLELFGPGPTDHFFDLLRSISLSGLLLQFPNQVPSNVLASLLDLGHLTSIRTLAFSRGRFIRWRSEEDLKLLLEVCEGRGISIEYIEPGRSLFDV